MKRCNKPARKHLSTTIDHSIFQRLIPAIKKDWGGPFSSWLDYVATCYLHDSCKGCPYAEEEGQEKGGIGRVCGD